MAKEVVFSAHFAGYSVGRPRPTKSTPKPEQRLEITLVVPDDQTHAALEVLHLKQASVTITITQHLEEAAHGD